MLNIEPVLGRREREKGVLVYPVYSRRSGGLSVGINLFPDKKSCPFDCPYCEVFPFLSGKEFSLEQMEQDLRYVILSSLEQGIVVRDICFSGNGEPSLSPYFGGALKLAQNIRAQTAPSSKLVVITNGAGLLQPQIFSLLQSAAENPSLDIWLKLDAATPEWHQKINCSSLPFEELIEKKKEFFSCLKLQSGSATIQTMLCAINGAAPPQKEVEAWEELVCTTAEGVRKVQLYGKARSAPQDPLASQLPQEYLEKRSASLRSAFADRNISVPVETYL